ncbi:MAG: peptidoglycan DD-metalloendopeptidase family protein [bacterium]
MIVISAKVVIQIKTLMDITKKCQRPFTHSEGCQFLSSCLLDLLSSSLLKRVKITSLIIIILSLSCSCSRTFAQKNSRNNIKKGVYHKVKKGQTLWRIAKTYAVKQNDLIKANKLKDPGNLEVGERLFIPGVGAILEVDIYRDFSLPSIVKKEDNKSSFIWPVKGIITSGFGLRADIRHNGIDINVPTGTPIKAANKGNVNYVGCMRGYGNIIIIKHDNDYLSVYAHNKKNLVKINERVKQGQIIGEVGNSGRTTGSHLHFEIRKGKNPVNPITLLPPD